MLRTSFRAFVVLAVVAFAFAAHKAEAGWHHHHHRGGYGYGCCGSSGGWAYGSWGSSGGSWGSSGGSWGSSGGSWGSSGGSWGSSGGSWGSSGGSSGGYRVVPSTPAAPMQPAPGAVPPAPANPPGPSDAAPAPTNSTYHPTYGPMRNSALLSVKVPADAKVYVNGRETTSTGTERDYISRDLHAGAHYNYEVRAEFTRDGQSISESKSIQMTAGQTANVDFIAGAPSVQTASTAGVQTTLIVHVPADAKLFLAGHETKATGEVREFTTTRLNSGSEWTTYAIRAEIERDGKTQVREESVSLKAGESRDVNLVFDAPAGGDRIANADAR